MENVIFFETTNDITGEVTLHAIIEHADGSHTTMPKAVYDEQQAALSTPSLPE